MARVGHGLAKTKAKTNRQFKYRELSGFDVNCFHCPVVQLFSHSIVQWFSCSCSIILSSTVHQFGCIMVQLSHGSFVQWFRCLSPQLPNGLVFTCSFVPRFRNYRFVCLVTVHVCSNYDYGNITHHDNNNYMNNDKHKTMLTIK